VKEEVKKDQKFQVIAAEMVEKAVNTLTSKWTIVIVLFI